MISHAVCDHPLIVPTAQLTLNNWVSGSHGERRMLSIDRQNLVYAEYRRAGMRVRHSKIGARMLIGWLLGRWFHILFPLPADVSGFGLGILTSFGVFHEGPRSAGGRVFLRQLVGHCWWLLVTTSSGRHSTDEGVNRLQGQRYLCT